MNRTKEECKIKAPDHLEGIPDTDAAITEASGDEAEGVLLGGGSRRLPPREAVEALGTGAGAGDGEIVGVRLEVELKDLEIGRRAEGEIDGARHGAGGEVGRVGREGDKRRSRGTLDAGHGIAGAGALDRALISYGKKGTGSQIRRASSISRLRLWETEKRRAAEIGSESRFIWTVTTSSNARHDL